MKVTIALDQATACSKCAHNSKAKMPCKDLIFALFIYSCEYDLAIRDCREDSAATT